MNFIISLIGVIFITIAEVFSWYSISKTKIPYKSKELYLKVIMLIICIFINHYYFLDFINTLLTILIGIVFCKLILNFNVRKTILLSFLGELAIILSEAIIYIIITVFFKLDANYISSSVSITLFVNIIVGLLCIMITKLKFVHQLYVMMYKVTENIKVRQILIFTFFVALGSNIFTTSVYFQTNLIITLTMNLFISIIYTIIIILAFNYQNKYYKINSKYKMSLEDLQAQENLINEYRIINHENKNQLMTIKSMTNNKKVVGYINSLIQQKNKFNNSIIKDSLKLPQGGIRGLIYNKMLLMKENNIKYFLNVDRNINYKIMSFLSNDDVVDICNILGVFLDNAIEESVNLNNGKINMDFHLSDSELIINISNKTKTDVKVLKNLKSTKGKNRGYGLKLVKKIVDTNDKISNETEITKDIFSQKLIYRL